jgi:hypothetical protein
MSVISYNSLDDGMSVISEGAKEGKGSLSSDDYGAEALSERQNESSSNDFGGYIEALKEYERKFKLAVFTLASTLTHNRINSLPYSYFALLSKFLREFNLTVLFMDI